MPKRKRTKGQTTIYKILHRKLIMGGRPENPTGGMPWYPPGLVNCSPPALFLLLDPCLLPGCSARAGRFGSIQEK
jgi:hypothetical protein